MVICLPRMARISDSEILQILAHELDAIGGDLPRSRNEPQNGAAEGRFARARFPDDAELLAAELEADRFNASTTPVGVT